MDDPASRYGILGACMAFCAGGLAAWVKAIRRYRPAGVYENGNGNGKESGKEIGNIKRRLDQIEGAASGLRSDFNTFRDVEFPSHAVRIRSLEVVIREIQDRQNEMIQQADNDRQNTSASFRRIEFSLASIRAELSALRNET